MDMSIVTPAAEDDLCQEPLIAGRDSHTEPCRSRAAVQIDGVAYCATHADGRSKSWRKRLEEQQASRTKLNTGLGVTTNNAAGT